MWCARTTPLSPGSTKVAKGNAQVWPYAYYTFVIKTGDSQQADLQDGSRTGGTRARCL